MNTPPSSARTYERLVQRLADDVGTAAAASWARPQSPTTASDTVWSPQPRRRRLPMPYVGSLTSWPAPTRRSRTSSTRRPCHRIRPPQGDTVITVRGVRGEPTIPADPARGKVWSAIAKAVRRTLAKDRLKEALTHHSRIV